MNCKVYFKSLFTYIPGLHVDHQMQKLKGYFCYTSQTKQGRSLEILYRDLFKNA